MDRAAPAPRPRSDGDPHAHASPARRVTVGRMWARFVIGALLIVVGIVWIFQGVGTLHGSFMTDEPVWAVIGAVAVLFGVALLVGAQRIRRSR
jgi:hypothetical protein